MQTISRLLALAILIFTTQSLAGQTTYRQIDQYLDLINAEYSGETALQTTAYVSERWRLPGNAGFDSSIYYVQRILQKAGFEASEQPLADRMTYRIERNPLRLPAWEPQDASLRIVGKKEPLLAFSSNRNMIAINSFSTPADGVEAEVVYLPGCDPEALEKMDVRGKIVMADCHSHSLYRIAVEKFGALGVLAYRIPNYNQPERFPNSIPFSSIPFNTEFESWAINLSYAARSNLLQALEAGPVRVRVNIQTRISPGEELTLIAEIPGTELPEERFVYSAHVQEPGANDNASGVGALSEMARVAARLFQTGKVRPARTLTFIWGDEIRATRRYIQEDEARAKGIGWGMSMDMVGEDTEKTGGTFLIEKMPDPSAIWTRGTDKHTEWGASPVSEENFNPHYFNDVVEGICRRQALRTNWTVNTNPFEGGSDHQPFLDARIPGLLFWHFTDVFYHTDADRIDKVSAQTLKNVGCSALSCGFLLTAGTKNAAQSVLDITKKAALKRLDAELDLSIQAVKDGQDREEEQRILQSWRNWYRVALPKVSDILISQMPKSLRKHINDAVEAVDEKAEAAISVIGN
ncbi:M28 family peptidase [Flavilitoribacter nigricans]|uniref:Peptidase M28 n=1 Tax=Flavilitoribacter nigricans (strain ATCC 23147 / DSM 23189 / NBRC 102662 / NCIMB 1420 / SS-2) TaxID=1122177 RepID=A0A2D0NFZ4_FLAN2|nr:M28 family peptidase [Flavilitoribacter nigricans]PHN07397.1 peptidase M28 [Flavilitoribacter nigricans DSM 23189 = NBRC 102662]